MNFSRNCELNFIPSVGLDLPGLLKAGGGRLSYHLIISSTYHLIIIYIILSYYQLLFYPNIMVHGHWSSHQCTVANAIKSHYHDFTFSLGHFSFWSHTRSHTCKSDQWERVHCKRGFGWQACESGWWLASAVVKTFISGAGRDLKLSGGAWKDLKLSSAWRTSNFQEGGGPPNLSSTLDEWIGSVMSGWIVLSWLCSREGSVGFSLCGLLSWPAL